MTLSALEWQGVACDAANAGDGALLVYAIRRSLALNPNDPNVHMALITNLDMLPWTSDQVKRKAREEFDRRFVQPIMRSGAAVKGYARTPDPDRRLRIGYVSSDLFASSAAFCHGALILGSSKADCDLYIYHTQSPRAEPDDMVTPIFREAASVWRDVTGMSDHEVASQIVSDQIDILVDLGGYSSGARMLVFAYRPAPIQITGWGHATGTDLSCFDYTVADRVTIPPEDEHRHREDILRVPSIIIYVPTRPGDGPESHPITYQPTDHIRFGNLGRAEKISQPCIAAWADILHAVPNSTLTLKCEAWSHDQRRSQVLVPLGAYGIGADRVIFHGQTTVAEHLAVYNQIDVHLDAFPHSGGVTMMDACWMGCPSVTMLGDTISARVGASILTTLGMGSCTAQTATEYVAIALRLANRAAFVGAEGRRLNRNEMQQSVLVDQQRYATSVEAGYREIWRRYCAAQTNQTAELQAV